MNQKGIFPPARSPRGIAAVAYATNMPPACLLYAAGPSGEVNSPPDQLRGASRNAASQWLRRAFLLASDWAKAGVQPKGGWRFFGSLLCVQPVGLYPHRRPQGVQMRESESGSGPGRPRKKPGLGARSPRKAEGRSQPASGITGSHLVAFPPTRRAGKIRAQSGPASLPLPGWQRKQPAPSNPAAGSGAHGAWYAPGRRGSSGTP